MTQVPVVAWVSCTECPITSDVTRCCRPLFCGTWPCCVEVVLRRRVEDPVPFSVMQATFNYA